MRSLLSLIGRLFTILFTGGEFGSYVKGPTAYEKRQQQRERDFEKHGGHACKRCGARIPANKMYCYPCYLVVKKTS